jgi:hypothetical protein
MSVQETAKNAYNAAIDAKLALEVGAIMLLADLAVPSDYMDVHANDPLS